MDKILPENIRKMFGERNRNIFGPCVNFDPFGGNTIHISYGVLIDKNSIHKIISMQQKISEL